MNVANVRFAHFFRQPLVTERNYAIMVRLDWSSGLQVHSMFTHIRHFAISMRSLLRALRAVRHARARVVAGPVGCACYHTADSCVWQTDALPHSFAGTEHDLTRKGIRIVFFFAVQGVGRPRQAGGTGTGSGCTRPPFRAGCAYYTL
jgi:hypothetical protein